MNAAVNKMIEVVSLISIKRNGVPFLDPFKTELLKEIISSGSLRKAASNLNISYQHAWNIISEVNHAAPSPLVIKQRGGANGGGAIISDYGTRILKEYDLIEAEVRKVISQINVEINL